MTEPNGTPERRAVGAAVRWMQDWPTWLLVFLFLILATTFALLGVLDDWARAVLAFTFVGIAASLLARFRHTDAS